MKILSLVIVWCLSCISLSAQTSFLDPYFGSGGIVIESLGPGTLGGFSAVAQQHDGKILASGGGGGLPSGGSSGFVMRFRENGVLDSSFAINGIFRTPEGSGVVAFAFQSDGKIVLVANDYQFTNRIFLTVRLTEDGLLDSSFNDSGKVYTNFGGHRNEYPTSIKLQQDGKIIIAGSVQNDSIALVRLLANGRNDSSFGCNGLVTTKAGFYGGVAYGLAIMSDGRIVAGGISNNGGAGRVSFIVVRYLANGSLDTSFNHTGKVYSLVGDTWNECRALLLQADNKVIVGGAATFGSEGNNFTLVRYNANGTMDSSFGNDGVTNIDFNGEDDRCNSLCFAPDSTIIAAGYINRDSVNRFGIARISKNGNLESSRWQAGKLETDVRHIKDRINGSSVQADGKILVCGFSDYSTNHGDAIVARYGLEVTGIEEINSSLEPILYPNPAKDILNVNVESYGSIETVKVTNSFGRQISLSLIGPGNIDIEDLPCGLYLFDISFSSGTKIKRKVEIKN